MPCLFAIPNELLDRVAFYLGPRDTSHLLITCRLLYSNLAPAMLRHAAASKDGMNALHWAAKKGYLPLVQRLLPLFPVDLPDAAGRTALQTSASARSNLLVLSHLLVHGADVNHVDHSGLSALHYAFQRDVRNPATVEATVRLLITHGANVNIESKSPASVPLSFALYAGLPNAGRLLLDAGADPNWVNQVGNPLLLELAQAGDTEWLELLLDYGADIDCCNGHRSNPLLLAAQYANLSTVKMLVEKGADLLCVNNDGDTPLVLAIQYGHGEIAEYLVGLEGVDVTSEGGLGDTPLVLAALVGWDPVLRMLLEKGCPVDHVAPRGRTALHAAVLHERNTIVQTLLEKGANVELVDSGGDTPLLLAIEGGFTEITDMLIAGGANLTSRGRRLLPPLTVACQFGLETIVNLLLEKGVDVNHRDEEGRTPMRLAEIEDRRGVVKILAAHGGVF